ncbi:MAG: hypothetical protein ACYDBQ_04330 [Thermoplasmatota archaeon]
MYTVRDDPEVVGRVEADLAHVVGEVRALDRGVQSIVLTGGFARGEGAFLGGRPQNDYDLVALRRPRWRPDYGPLVQRLEGRLGLHIDLAPVASWRLPWVSRSLFWYETALQGRVLWGENLLGRIPIRDAAHIDSSEGMRLLVNRSAGLLLALPAPPHEVRLQAAKGLLAACDALLLAGGAFAPTQRARWSLLEGMRAKGSMAVKVDPGLWSWAQWAVAWKLDPERNSAVDAKAAWQAARSLILLALPAALRKAGLESLDAYGRRDGIADHVVHWQRARRYGVEPLRWHPTGRVRVETLRLLKACPERRLPDGGGLLGGGTGALERLAALRRCTLQ